jgi:signal transduction histidine kinase
MFYHRSRVVLEEQLKDKLRDAVALAAMQFDASELEKIHTVSSSDVQVFRSVVAKLLAIKRTLLPYTNSVYIMRKTEDPNSLAFIADADTFGMPNDLDDNKDGLLQEKEVAALPGDLYDVSDMPALGVDAFLRPTTDPTFTTDQWGTVMSGYAPIRDTSGKTVAVIGIDMDAGQFTQLSQRIFSPLALLLTLSVGLFADAVIILWGWKRRVETFEELERERFGLLDMLLHQLGTPLASFRWWLEILAETEKEQDPKDKEACIRMQESVERMSAILASLLEASNVGRGTFAYRPEPTPLRDVVEGTILHITPRMQLRRQHVSLSFDERLGTVAMDRKWIETVLGELLDNASSFSPEGGTITVSVQKERKYVRIDVSDPGCGIPAQDLPRIGEKFVRGGNVLKYKPLGNGLGLFIVKGLVKRAGGDVRIKSTLGDGTSVSFTLPLF